MTGAFEDRRLVTVLFVDLVGFTGRAETEDPESLRDVQRAYFDAVSAVVDRYGGRVEKYIGDAVMALFGVPQAHDDDAERALHAALQMREAIRGLGYGLEVRVGVNTGEVVGGPGSGRFANEYTVTGDAVNVAARLQQAAEPGEILAGQVTDRLAGRAFELERLPKPITLKGRAETVRALRVVGVRPQHPTLRGDRVPLVGRSKELVALHAALDEAAAGRGRLVAIVGEAGIGKSRLALELRQHAEGRGFASVWATARSYSDAFPMHVLAQVSEQLLAGASGKLRAETLVACGVTADHATLERWAGVLGQILGHGSTEVANALTPTARQHALVQVTGQLLSALARQRPLLVVLDDLQWVDEASLGIFDEAIDIVTDSAVLAVALHRPGWKHDWTQKGFYEQVNLSALTVEETRALARELVGDLATSEPSAEIIDRSAGNPFFLEELLKAEADDREGMAGRHLPETVHEVVLARIDALPAEARQLLQAASVVGTEFTWPMLSAVVSDAGLDQALRTLQRQDLVVVRDGEAEPVLTFRHPLIHEVAYRSLLIARRRELHARIASWLVANGGGESLPAVASHYRDSDDVDQARIFLPKAADRAASLYAAHEAMRFYKEAAQLFSDEPVRRARLLEQAATQAYLIADLEQAVTLISEAIALYEGASESMRALDCRRRLGRYEWLIGRGDAAEAEIARAIEGLERLPPSPELALAYSYRSQIRFLMPDFAAGETWARKAIDLAQQTGATAALVHAYNNLGGSLLGLGDPSGQDYLRRSLDLAREHNLADDAVRAYVNLTAQGYHIALLPFAEQDRLLREGIAFAEQMIPGGAWHRWLQISLGEFLFHTGRWDDAERVLASPRLSRVNRYVAIGAAAIQALTAAHRGDYDRAAQLTRPEVDGAIRNGDLLGAAPVLTALAHVEAGLANGRAVLDALRTWVSLRGDVSEATITAWTVFEATDVVTWLAVNGDPAAAEGLTVVTSLADGMVADIRRAGPPAELAVRRALYGAAREQLVRLADRTRGLGPSADLDAMMIPSGWDAIALLDEAHRLFDAARIRLWLAEAGTTAGLAGAIDAFTHLGALLYLARGSAIHANSRSSAP